MSKIINFRARSKNEFEVHLKPYPAVKGLPKWFLDAKPYYNPDNENDNKLRVRNGVSNATFKKCTPLLDGMSAGYIIPLWTDIQLETIENQIEINWRTFSPVFAQHSILTENIETPLGYHSQVLKYLNCWIPQTPKGYSCLITSPLGYNDLPFKAVPAIVDTDKSTLELVFPVWAKKDFNGIVEKGTPIAQIIPFKRDDWTSTFDFYEDGKYKNIIEEKNFNTTIVSHYIKNVWSKKSFK